MLHKIFSFLSKNKKADLCINKKQISKNEPISIQDNELRIGKKRLKVELINSMQIYDSNGESIANESIDKENNNLPELYFQYQDDLYCLKGDITQIYKTLKPLIMDSFFVFKGKGVYFVYDRGFKEIGKGELKIINEDGYFYLRIENLKDDLKEVVKGDLKDDLKEHLDNGDLKEHLDKEDLKDELDKDKIKSREIIHFEQINPDIDFYTDRNNLSFVWASKNNNQIGTFNFLFSENSDFLEFLSKFLAAIRGENDSYFEKMEIDNYNYREAENQRFEDDLKEDDFKDDDFKDDDFKDDDFEDDEDKNKLGIQSKSSTQQFQYEDFNNSMDDKNSLLVTDKNRAYVTRGTSLGIFSTEDQLKFVTRIKSIDKDLKKILPNNDNLICLNSNDNKLKILNLERGEVVENWDVNRNIIDCFGDRKYYRDVLVGVNENELFRIDKRMKEKVINVSKEGVFKNFKNTNDFNKDLKGILKSPIKKGDNKDKDDLKTFKDKFNFKDEIQITDSKVYKTKVDFKFGQSTESGNIAIVNSKGDLRLYDKIGKNAKTLIPGFRNEIRGIDVSDNGRYVVVTSKNVIIFYVVNENYSKRTNFKINTNCNLNLNNDDLKDIPIFKRLQLKPEHLAFINEEVSFTPAHFEKNHILTSTGKYIIFWNIEEILKGNLFSYQIKRYNSNIVADSFRFGDDNEIIVALPDDVKMIGKDKLIKGDRVFRYRND